jgi:hypothetical protein
MREVGRVDHEVGRHGAARVDLTGGQIDEMSDAAPCGGFAVDIDSLIDGKTRIRTWVLTMCANQAICRRFVLLGESVPGVRACINLCMARLLRSASEFGSPVHPDQIFEESVMKSASTFPGHHVMCRRATSIRYGWTPAERDRRAQLGRQRRDRLVTEIMPTVTPAEIWSVGAETVFDLKPFAERRSG